jgi:hypothetical protein
MTMLQRSMTNELTINGRLSDPELLDEVKRLTAHERQATTRLITALGELDARRLYLGQGCSSLFGQCAFVGAVGRCTERGFLEYHHRVPYADGGTTTLDNLELRCRAHNAYEAQRWFGARAEDLVRERRADFFLREVLDDRAAIRTLRSALAGLGRPGPSW